MNAWRQCWQVILLCKLHDCQSLMSHSQTQRRLTTRKEAGPAAMKMTSEIPAISEAIVQFHQFDSFGFAQGKLVGAASIKVI